MRTRSRRWWQRTAWRVTAGVLTLAMACWAVLAFVILRPQVDAQGHSDALVILGPSWPWRTETAQRLMERGAADVLVVSAHPEDTRGSTPGPCRGSEHLPYRVICFDPDPATTQGEARAVARLARENGWHDVQALTFAPQIARARLLLGRCYDGRLRMLENPEPYSRLDQLIYQSGAFVKAVATPGC